jgi:hypothetical protein
MIQKDTIPNDEAMRLALATLYPKCYIYSIEIKSTEVHCP